MAKIIRLTESDLIRLVKKVLKEEEGKWPDITVLDFLANKTFKFTYKNSNGYDFKTGKTVRTTNMFKVDKSYFSMTAGGPVVSAKDGVLTFDVLPIDEISGKEIPSGTGVNKWMKKVNYVYNCKTKEQYIKQLNLEGDGTKDYGTTTMADAINSKYCSKYKPPTTIKPDYSKNYTGSDDTFV